MRVPDAAPLDIEALRAEVRAGVRELYDAVRRLRAETGDNARLPSARVANADGGYQRNPEYKLLQRARQAYNGNYKNWSALKKPEFLLLSQLDGVLSPCRDVGCVRRVEATGGWCWTFPELNVHSPSSRPRSLPMQSSKLCTESFILNGRMSHHELHTSSG